MDKRSILTVAVCVALAGTLAACNRGDSADGGGSGSVGPIGVDFPRADTDFWNSYNKYVPTEAKDLGINLMTPTNSQNDITKLVSNVQAMTAQGAKAIVMAPQDTGAIASTISQLNQQKIPVVTVDTRPDKGGAFMVVRADNKAYGEKACKFLGEQIKGKGKVVEFEGDLSSVNGRDRSEAFRACVKKKYPKLKVLEIPAKWESDAAASKLDTLLNANPDIKGIYMQAGGVYLAPTLQTLKSKNLLKTAGQKGHIVIVSNDGIPQEFDAIRKGQIDATVSQPADAYAKYGMYYIKAAMAGKSFKPGPTDHDSTIVKLPSGILEDQLPAPLVTKENVDDPKLWGNTVK